MNKQMEEIVFSYPKLRERINGRENEMEKARKNLKEIAAVYSPKVLGSFTKLIDLSVKKLYDDINIDSVDKFDLRSLAKENNVVLVPNHQSHADYVAINYIIYKIFRIPLYVAGGINLNVFPIGPLFRRSGCFFIRRTFASDILYKLTLEGYLYYLLMEKKLIEFFFEGGRTRSGKLLPPRYGLYQMLLDAHAAIPEEKRSSLLFVPVSIVHEYVPEQGTLAKELEGKKKKKESLLQLLKIFKLFTKEFGSVHIRLGKPVERLFNPTVEPKKITQRLAFDCFWTVSKNMVITPSSLLALILLDAPRGALEWDDISRMAVKIIDYCQRYKIPFSHSLRPETLESTLERAIDLFISNKKINVFGRTRYGHVFYSIKEEARLEILYFKNSILHHFLIPSIINLGWINLFNGNITSVSELKNFFIVQREQLKHEFYLPSAKDYLRLTLEIVSDCIGRKIKGLHECVNFSNKDLYRLASKLGVFGRGCSYIYEGLYLTGVTIKHIIDDSDSKEFSKSRFNKEFKEVFELELSHGGTVKYYESCSTPLIKNCFMYYTNQNVLENKFGSFEVVNEGKLNRLIENYSKILRDQLMFNVRT